MRRAVVGLIASLVLVMVASGASLAQSPVVSSPSPAAAPKEDPAVTARARDWLARLQTGNVDKSQLTPDFAQRMTPEYLKQVTAALAPLGTPSDWTYVGSQPVTGGTIYGYKLLFGTASHTWVVVISPDGKIGGSGMK